MIIKKGTLGRGLEVTGLGFGYMGPNFSYGHVLANADIVKLIRNAHDRGVGFFDTAKIYGPFTNEELVGEALCPVRDEVVISTKFCFKFEDGKAAGVDSRPERIREAAEGSLKRLGIETIDLTLPASR
ncbi:aryl-alcohol dehydrogenase-like predicted oxidoreductase [Neorhizobium sp. 2083]|nr:aryl-alcohol dehydrogenase-like predicted oxidoreductase [Neorhizobium sp. 2083]